MKPHSGSSFSMGHNEAISARTTTLEGSIRSAWIRGKGRCSLHGQGCCGCRCGPPQRHRERLSNLIEIDLGHHFWPTRSQPFQRLREPPRVLSPSYVSRGKVDAFLEASRHGRCCKSVSFWRRPDAVLQIVLGMGNRCGLTTIESHWCSEESSSTRVEALRRGGRDLLTPLEHQNEHSICKSLDFCPFCAWSPDGISEQETLNLSQLAHNNGSTITRRIRCHVLSSALIRAGKKVLHCDGNEWYGGFDAVLYTGSTLDCFIEGCQEAGVCNLAQDKKDWKAWRQRDWEAGAFATGKICRFEVAFADIYLYHWITNYSRNFGVILAGGSFVPLYRMRWRWLPLVKFKPNSLLNKKWCRWSSSACFFIR
jgi:hypothetical protein